MSSYLKFVLERPFICSYSGSNTKQ